MKLQNKKTGEIVEDAYVRETHDFQFDGQKHILAVFRGNGHRPPERISGPYNSLAELNEEWEDYEEPNGYWAIDMFAKGATYLEDTSDVTDKFNREIGNKFETEEGCERAIEKMKAWTRLEAKGFRFTHWECTGSISFTFDNYCGDGQPMSASEDLDLLFGGEE